MMANSESMGDRFCRVDLTSRQRQSRGPAGAGGRSEDARQATSGYCYCATDRCRICDNPKLLPILDLGEQALTGVFPKSTAETVPCGPIELVKCDEQVGGCGLVQLRHSYRSDMLYGGNYGYRSGLNQTMVRHLQRRVRCALEIARPDPGDLIVDIGSNDGTTLAAYSPGTFTLVGVDPTGRKFARYYRRDIELIPDFFNARTIADRCPGRKAKIITSLAMFYDLESPQEFVRDVYRVLDDNGIWIFEQSYLPTMLEQSGYDTVCHEHLEYYALRQIKWLADRNGFVIVDVELNDVNGGSFCVTAAKRTSRRRENARCVEELLAKEDEAGLSSLQPFLQFRRRTQQHRASLRNLVADIRDCGRTLYGYGASTKGNVLLQFCGFTAGDIPAIFEINEDKFGAMTPKTLIPIVPESEIPAIRPDHLLVLPWHFREGIIQRESKYLEGGGKLVFPLPHLEVVSKNVRRRVAA